MVRAELWPSLYIYILFVIFTHVGPVLLYCLLWHTLKNQWKRITCILFSISSYWQYLLLPRPRRGLRGIVFTRSVCVPVCLCVSICPANILVFYYSAIRGDIDMKFTHHTYGVVFNSLGKKTFIGQWSRSQGRYIVFWRYSHITKTD